MERIGVRELRQHASRYLARVAAGERIEVTDRGRPVAMLVPAESDAWQALIVAGRLRPAEGHPLDELAGSYDVDASAELDAVREER